MTQLGPIGRLGHWTATRLRGVAVAWLVIAVAFGIFAPRWSTPCPAPAGRPPAPNPAKPAR
jgi:hypothetical protein